MFYIVPAPTFFFSGEIYPESDETLPTTEGKKKPQAPQKKEEYKERNGRTHIQEDK
jgi:hypothetical protein